MSTHTQDRTLTMPDGRAVGFSEYGAPNGNPVIWCHGGPGCRREPEYLASAATDAGLRLIGIDRPGYGLSTPQPNRTIGGWVGDALAVADRLGISSFATVGSSTGGAYALALAASSERVTATVACCTLTDMRWAEGRAMMLGPLEVWSAASREDAWAVATKQFGASGEQMELGRSAMPLAVSDVRMFENPGWARAWNDMTADMFAHGVAGYTDDRRADGAGWHTFDVGRIACPVVVLHGTGDTLVPVAHAHHTQRIVPGAALALRPELGHFSILLEVVPLLRTILGPGRAAPRVRGARAS